MNWATCFLSNPYHTTVLCHRAYAAGKAFLSKPKCIQLLEILGLALHVGGGYSFSDPEKIELNLYFTGLRKQKPDTDVVLFVPCSK
jgi:hypothetical protein